MLHPPRLYVYLDAVARAGSIRKAAEVLHVASTALNRKILEAEEDLGTPLFERLPRGVRLTAAGEVMLSFVRRSLSELEAATSTIEQLQGLMRGVVRLGCAESVGTDIVPRIVAGWQARHPGVQFHIQVGGTQSLMASLLEDEVELVIAHDPPPGQQVKVLADMPQPLHVMMRPGHPLASRKTLRLADCEAYPVALGDASFGSRRLLDAHVARSRIRLRTVAESGSVETIKAFARHGDALCFQFEAGTRRDTALGELVSLPLTDAGLAGSRLQLVARSGRSLPIAALTFAETLKGALFGA
ncbi:LysR family transcriptional regulator [Noviherbaspirillum suwonense]|jgi:DNA-binding transcriptional LysR family regulator|uniref:DNA-binding transcriptional regulator, LysR family n=1 Tax=Noviherbaspirillum suwonense TaxID=1224511 RepID=A0ABY1Q319_9BURK|nr:LysR substrate-binding domain-containing protein [Noviherbaspirillum suwonense]SMP57793.1 DNA-binding transcriptional regulator, LysR family [Noviherbaspirillum suwonense]